MSMYGELYRFLATHFFCRAVNEPNLVDVSRKRAHAGFHMFSHFSGIRCDVKLLVLGMTSPIGLVKLVGCCDHLSIVMSSLFHGLDGL